MTVESPPAVEAHAGWFDDRHAGELSRVMVENVREVRGLIAYLLAEPALPQPDSPVTPGAPQVEFDQVGFGYGPDKTVLQDISFTAAPGTTTAIVGPSGAGKSTLLRLAAHFHDADSGRVLVGGHDVREQPAESLLGRLALVFQNVYLFDRSVLENIRAGRPDATEAEVLAAGRVARVDEIAERLPDGWHTAVGEAGSALSGGERQRVSIARALVEDAPIVLLDEATSALDPHNEAAVVRGVHELTRGRTVLVVAHRPATIAHADQILFMDGGRIVERGTHVELLALGGRYSAFWCERTRASGWRLAPVPAWPDGPGIPAPVRGRSGWVTVEAPESLSKDQRLQGSMATLATVHSASRDSFQLPSMSFQVSGKVNGSNPSTAVCSVAERVSPSSVTGPRMDQRKLGGAAFMAVPTWSSSGRPASPASSSAARVAAGAPVSRAVCSLAFRSPVPGVAVRAAAKTGAAVAVTALTPVPASRAAAVSAAPRRREVRGIVCCPIFSSRALRKRCQAI
ncbi:ABC transporter ATP-binding protein [Nocardia niigatensis]